jgi:hypothetical protein
MSDMQPTEADREDEPVSAQNMVLKLRSGIAITDEDDIPDYLFSLTTGEAFKLIQKYGADAVKAEREIVAAQRNRALEAVEKLREALQASTDQLDAMNTSPVHAGSWVEPRSHTTTERIALNRETLASTEPKPLTHGILNDYLDKLNEWCNDHCEVYRSTSEETERINLLRMREEVEEEDREDENERKEV